MKNNKKLNKIYISMLHWRKYKEKEKDAQDSDEDVTNSSGNTISHIYTNFNYNLMIIKEVNRWKSKEEITLEENKMRKHLLNKKRKYFKAKRDLYSGKYLDHHKSNIMYLVSYSIYLILFIVIVILQLKIHEAFYSYVPAQRAADQSIILGDKYFNFEDIPTFRSLNSTYELSLIREENKNNLKINRRINKHLKSNSLNKTIQSHSKKNSKYKVIYCYIYSNINLWLDVINSNNSP